MSSSRRRDEMAAGVGEFAERASKMFPPAFMKSRRFLGVREGP